jgi:hypothetical protein
MKKNTILLIGGVAALGGMLWYFSKPKMQPAIAAPVQPGQPGPDTQVKLSTSTTSVLKPSIQNTGIMPPPLAVQASRPVVAAEPLPLLSTSAGLRPAAGVLKSLEISRTSALRGPWLSMN